MLITDPQSPATKEDIGLLMEMIGKYFVETDDKLKDLRQELKTDMSDLKQELKKDMNNLKLYFDFNVERLRTDYLDVNRVENTMIKDRLTYVERKVGIR